MKHLLGEVRKLLGLLMLLRGLSSLQEVGIRFILFQLQLQHQKKLGVEGMMGAVVRSLCYLFVGMLCLGLRLLVVQVSFQILQ